MVGITRNEKTTILHITDNSKESDALKTREDHFITLKVDDIECPYNWVNDFSSSLQNMCIDLTTFTKVEQVVLVNTEGQIYNSGQFRGFTYPIVYRVEITSNEPLNISIEAWH